MNLVIINGQVFRSVTALSRRDELWAGVGVDCEQIKKMAESKKSDINRVAAVKEQYLELRQKLRELGCW